MKQNKQNNELEIIYAYTRKQAVEDGEQWKLEGEQEEMAKQLYKYPVYLSGNVTQMVELAVNNKKHCNDINGVLWDILYMSRYASKEIDQQTKSFEVIITGTGSRKYKSLLIQVGPTDIDDPRPALTIMTEEEL